MNPMKVSTLVACGLIALTGYLIWHPAGQTAPSTMTSQGSCPFCDAASAGSPQKPGKASVALPAVGNQAAAKSSDLSSLPPQNANLASNNLASKTDTELAATGKVAVTVNGERITESELMASMPEDAFQTQSDDLKETKFRRLIEEAIEWQFLKDRKVTLSDDEFEKARADFETMVTTPGCPCCGGGFKSIEQFMEVNAFSPGEIHRRITCDSGLKLYAARLEKEQTSPQALAERVKKQRAEIEKDCVTAYTIMFDYTHDGVYSRDDKAIQAEKEKIANDALARLKKGESFEKVAKEMSGPAGGALEAIPADYLDPEVQKVLATLEPDQISPVIKTSLGCCIVKRKKLTDEDILSRVKEQAKAAAENQMYQELDAWRKKSKIEYSAAYAQVSTSGKSGAK
jgi:parvulin-like peptidyl-prolyl isomerase